MKKFIFIIIPLWALSYTSGLAQQKVTLADKSISLTLPSDAIEVSGETARSHLSTNSVNSAADQKAIKTSPNKKFYMYNKTLLSLSPDNISGDADFLLSRKKGLDEISKSNNTYRSYIVSDENKSTLVTNYIWGEKGYYYIYSVNKKSNKIVNIRIEYDKQDTAASTQIVDNIKSGLRFID